MKNIDEYLCKIWNLNKPGEYQIVTENTWDFCRLLEEKGVLVGDPTAISTRVIGPFRIAEKLDIGRKDTLQFVIEAVFPGIISRTNNMQFSEVYALYLVPLASLLLNILDSCCMIKNILQWDILLYIKVQNQNGKYPTIEEIQETDDFRDVEECQIRDTVKELKAYKNLLGGTTCLITSDFDGKLKSSV